MSFAGRVCIVAEHASIKFGGEASLPFHYFRVLRARGADAHLVVHDRTREELLHHFPADADRIHFVRDTGLHRFLARASLLLPRRISEATIGLTLHLITQWKQRSLVRSLVTPGAVVHQPIPVSPRFPSLFFGVGAPVVIGPMNGGMDFPPEMKGRESALVRSSVSLGRAISGVVHLIVPGKRRAAVLLVANARTRAALPRSTARVIELVENGVELDQWVALPEASGQQTKPRFLFLGRLVDWKALDILLQALVRVPDADVDIVGDGPMLESWRALAADLRIADRVHFHGWRTQAECANMLRSATALVLPSLYECGGAVVLEAMAAARPVIATNWGGPADYLDETCGILVAPTSRDALIAGFATAMQTLAADTDLCNAMGSAGHARVLSHYDWEKKVDRIEVIYAETLANKAKR